MLENTPDTAAAALSGPGRRYVPPNQRTRRKSGDRSETTTTTTTPQSLSRSVSDAEERPQLFVTLDGAGASTSEASRLLQQRWDSAIDACNDASLPETDRPVVYSGTVVELPHQLMSTTQNQMDFLLQLRQQKRPDQ